MSLPPLSRTAADAEAVARIVHEGQRDKAGRPYIEHVERVEAGAIRLMDEMFPACLSEQEVRSIAWLHDTLEPDPRPFGPMTFSDLVDEGFSTPILDGVERLCRWPAFPYAEHIRLIAEHAPLPVLLVKLADLEDNSDPARLALLPTEKAASLSKRYGPAKAAIRSAIGERFGRPQT